jgi:small-conductance mechanosensitive channel
MSRVLYAGVTILDLVVVTVVVLLAIIGGKVLTIYLKRALRDRMSRGHLEILAKALYYGLIAIAVIVALALLGVNLSGLMVAGGIAGIVIGFASQRIVGNLISGIFLIVERPVNIGNQVNIDGTTGFVEDINIFSTIVRTYDGLYVRLPNEKVFTTEITNYVANVARRFEYTIGIRYSDDAQRAMRIIRRLVDEHPFALLNPAPEIFVDSLGESSVDIVVRVWGPTSEWYELKKELLWKIKTSLEAEGIEIPFPQRVVWLANKSQDDALPQ